MIPILARQTPAQEIRAHQAHAGQKLAQRGLSSSGPNT